jgi:hypothetical protein
VGFFRLLVLVLRSPSFFRALLRFVFFVFAIATPALGSFLITPSSLVCAHAQLASPFSGLPEVWAAIQSFPPRYVRPAVVVPNVACHRTVCAWSRLQRF